MVSDDWRLIRFYSKFNSAMEIKGAFCDSPQPSGEIFLQVPKARHVW